MAQTISYNLDSLGWMQFESLIQVLLKAELGMGVELWGGSADHGRDAYCPSELNFPNRHTTNPGPFVFQAKFIASANATGADFETSLLGGVRKEATLIQNRVEAGKWKAPQHYCLLTNAPLTVNHRETIVSTLKPILGECVISIQGATDICALLDLNITVARSFPQVLSLRNLFELLDQVVRNEIVQRTDAVIREAEALAGVFVPTKAFDEAWDVLEKHNFVVLEGAPEMGKTAIAWIIAAVMLARKWQAVDCDKPGDFFAAYSEQREQVFIADDAFGTTEYDVNRGSEWGRQLHKVIPKLNKRHWLIWTSRMTILQQALQEMSLQGSASKFPDHKEILVKASKLEDSERALMLYRHSRAAELSDGSKNIVRSHAKEIVGSPHFTPERIRRFVREALPDLEHEFDQGNFTETQLSNAIKDAIENPTERMRKAYRQLQEIHRSVLIAMLDCERSPGIKELEAACKRFGDSGPPIQEQIDLLKEGFLQSSIPHWNLYSSTPVPEELGVDWIHPSYRDLVIEELERDPLASEHFLEHCSWIGLQLALSIAGGAKGQRRYPLMNSDRSWIILKSRLVALLEDAASEYEVRRILQTVRGSLEGTEGMADVHRKLAEIIVSCCDAIRNRLALHPSELDERMLREYYELSMSITPPPRMPEMYTLQKKLQNEFEAMLKNSEDSFPVEEDVLSKWIALMQIVMKTDRRLLIQDGFPEKYTELIEKLCNVMDSEADEIISFSDEEGASAEADRLSAVATDLEELAELFPEHEVLLRRVSRQTERRSRSFQETGSRSHDSDQTKWTGQRSVSSSPALDLERLFSDL